jgi:hypothetical protein
MECDLERVPRMDRLLGYSGEWAMRRGADVGAKRQIALTPSKNWRDARVFGMRQRGARGPFLGAK